MKTCPNCKEMNGNNLTHCFKCNTPLSELPDNYLDSLVDPPKKFYQKIPFWTAVLLIFTAIIILVVFCSSGSLNSNSEPFSKSSSYSSSSESVSSSSESDLSSSESELPQQEEASSSQPSSQESSASVQASSAQVPSQSQSAVIPVNPSNSVATTGQMKLSIILPHAS